MTIFIDMLILVLVTLFFVTIRLTEQSSNFMALFLIAVASFFVFKYLFFFEIEGRRAYLDHHINDNSEIKKKLWNSPFIIIKVSLLSILFAFSIIFSIAKIDNIEAAFIFGSILTFKLIYAILSQITYKHFKPSTRKQNTLRISYYLNLLIVAVALSFYQLYTNNYDYISFESIKEATTVTVQSANNGIITTIFNWLETVEKSIILGLQKLTLSDELSVTTKITLWISFFIYNAIQIFLFWLVLLGTQTIVNEQRQHGWKSLGDSVFSKQFTISLIVLFALYLAVSKVAEIGGKVVNTLQTTSLEDFAPPEVKQIESTCEIEKINNETILNEQKINANANLASHYADFEKLVDNRVLALNTSLEKNVDKFLDWHFSVAGQYTQLGYLAASAVYPEKLEGLLNDKVFNAISNTIHDEMGLMDTQISENIHSTLNNYIKSQDTYLSQLSFSNECYPDNDFISSVQINESPMLLDEIGMKVSGVAVAIVGLKLGGKAFAKALSTKIAAKLSASTLAKLAAKAGISGSSAVAGVTCGPAAPLCAAGLAAGTWFAVDAAAVTVEEKVTREKFKVEIMTDVYEHTANLGAETKVKYADMLARGIQEVDSAKLRKFQPAQQIFKGK